MKDLREYLGIRANLYRTLAWPWYKEIDNAWTESYKRYSHVLNELSVSFKQSICDNVAYGADLNRQYEYFKKGIELLSSIPEKIDEEHYVSMYPLLFMGVDINSKHKSIVPYESVYLSPSGLVKQDEWEKVYEAFVREGIGKLDSFSEPEDHISSEMHFIAELTKQAIDAIDEGNNEMLLAKLNAQIKFLSEHTTLWIGKLLEHLRSVTDDVIYLSVAYVTAGFIHSDLYNMQHIAQMYAEASKGV